jgi:hypothetical protein
MTNQVKKALITIAEFAINQLASVIAQHLIEMRRREATTKITSGEKDVQLLGQSFSDSESEKQASRLRVITN